MSTKQSLDAVAREQLEKARSSSAGRSAVTVFGGNANTLRQTVIALREGGDLAEHENPGEATLQVLSGRVVLRAGEVSWEGRDGALIVIPKERHSLVALVDSVVLLTVAKID